MFQTSTRLAVLQLLFWAYLPSASGQSDRVPPPPIMSLQPLRWLPASDDTDLDYMPSRHYLTVQNNFPEVLHLSAIELEVTNFRTNDLPHLVFDIAPFLDSLVIRATNLGWKPSAPTSLSPFSARARANRNGPLLYDLFDIRAHTGRVGQITDNAIFEFPIGPNASPFSFVNSLQLDQSISQRPRPTDGIQTELASNVKYEWGKEDIGIDRTRRRFSGACAFTGVVHGDHGEETNVTYLGRQLESVELSELEEILSHAIGVGAEGSLFKKWRFAFGESQPWGGEQHTNQLRVGVTIDIKDGTLRQIRSDARTDIAPGKAVWFGLTLTSSRSCSFQVQPYAVYNYGTGRPWKHRIGGVLNCDVFAPRLDRLTVKNIGTLQFLRKLRKADPTVDQRAATLLQSIRRVPQISLAQYLDRHEVSWRFRDAILLAISSDDAKLRHLADELLDRTIAVPPLTWRVADMAAPGFLDEAFPILCANRPVDAVRIAIQSLAGTGYAQLLAYCIVFDATRPHLQTYTKDLTQLAAWCLTGAPTSFPPPSNQAVTGPDNGPPDHPPLPFPVDVTDGRTFGMALVASLSLHTLGHAVVKAIPNVPVDDGTYEVIAWAASRIRSPELDRAICLALVSPELAPSTATSIIGTLATTSNRRFRRHILEYTRAAAKDRSYTTAVLSCLRYIDILPADADVLAVLEELRDYPFESQVRDEVRRRLGEHR